MQTAIISLTVVLLFLTGIVIDNFLSIKNLSRTIKELQEDIALILLKTKDIERDARETHQLIIGEVDAKIDKLTKNNDKIDFIFNEMKYKERCEREYQDMIRNRF